MRRQDKLLLQVIADQYNWDIQWANCTTCGAEFPTTLGRKTCAWHTDWEGDDAYGTNG